MSKLAKSLTAAAGNAGESLYVEDVFSTYLYEGTDSAITITNGIDLSGEGGMVWGKSRSAAQNHRLYDTEGNGVYPNFPSGSFGTAGRFTANSDGFDLTASSGIVGSSGFGGPDYASWTFRKAEKFFDVVTWTGNGDGTDRNYNHNLNSVPNCVIVKRTDAPMDWGVYHSQLGTGAGSGLKLNTTDSIGSPNPIRATPSSTQIKIRGASGEYNENGATYVAYLFASDAGGFGDDGDESVIKCGSYTGNGTYLNGPEVNLGFEPQWLLIKSVGTERWRIADNMRGIAMGTAGAYLTANDTTAEVPSFGVELQATGFKLTSNNADLNSNGQEYIYIAIRRPMKTPESGTEVFAAAYGNASGSAPPTFTSGFAVDALLGMYDPAANGNILSGSRLTGDKVMRPSSTNAEYYQAEANWDYQNGVFDWVTASYFAWMFKRATGFFDVVAWTGTGSYAARNHNLGVVPELVIQKARASLAGGNDWFVNTATQYGYLNLTNSFTNFGRSLTSTTFQPVADGNVSWITYLFATLAGVSKVGSYTGTAADLNVDCGFSAGARFILIKRTDSSGDWYIWDSVRGIVAGNDPYKLLNDTSLDVTNTDYIDPLSSGFTVTSSAPAALNASGGNYIFLAIA